MEGRDLFAQSDPQPVEPEVEQTEDTGRDLFAEPSAAPAPVETASPVPQSQPLQVPVPVAPDMGALFDKYASGQMNPTQAAAFEELAKRRLTNRGQIVPKEEKGPGVLQQVGDTVVNTGKLAADAAAALPGSTLTVLNDMAKALMSPVATADAIGKLALGAVEKLVPGKQPHEEQFDSLVGAFKQKYGSLEALNKVIAEDPASVLLDMSTLFTGGGAAMTKVPKLAEVGKAMATVGDLMDPMRLGLKGGEQVAKRGGQAVERVLGATTGEGAEAIRQAKVGTGLTSDSSGFVAGMRGTKPGENILEDARSALSTVKADRGTRYRKQLEEIGRDKTNIDIRPIKQRLSEQMQNYGIKVDAEGNLDFSRSTLGKDAQNDVASIIEDISGWGTKAGDNTAAGLDVLKRRLDDFYTESKNSRALVSDLRNTVKNEIVAKVPEYAKMTREYEMVTNLTNEMERALSLGNRSMMDTALRKLSSTTKDNFEFRHNLVAELEKLSGRSLAQEIAGLNMSKVKPRSLLGGGVTAGAVATGLVSPWFVSMAAMTSPRLMGEFLNAVGFTRNQAAKAVMQLKKSGAFKPLPRQATAQAGRVTSEGELNE